MAWLKRIPIGDAAVDGVEGGWAVLYCDEE